MDWIFINFNELSDVFRWSIFIKSNVVSKVVSVFSTLSIIIGSQNITPLKPVGALKQLVQYEWQEKGLKIRNELFSKFVLLQLFNK